jgi:hypothetical protein
MDVKNIITANFRYRRKILCCVHELAKGIWQRKMDQINADPKGNWYRPVRKKCLLAYCAWIKVLKYDWTEGRREVWRLEDELNTAAVFRRLYSTAAVFRRLYSTCTGSILPRKILKGMQTSK